MKRIPAFALACLFAGAAHARPMIIEERSRIDNPDPGFPEFAAAVAVDGDFALVSAHRDIPPTSEAPFPERDFSALLFRRSASGWSYVRTLLTERHNEFDLFPYGIAMRDGIAAIATKVMHIYERGGDEWQAAASLASDPGPDVEVNAGRILRGGTTGTWAGELFERDAASGTWQLTHKLWGEFRGGDDEFSGGPVDLSGAYAAIASPNSDEPAVRTPSIAVYQQTGPSWGAVDNIVPPEGTDPYGPESFGWEVAMRGTDVVVSGSVRTGSWLFRPDPGGAGWVDQGRLQPLNGFMGGGPAFSIKKSDNFVLQRSLDPDRDVAVINVFAPDTNNAYQHVAVLRAGHGDSLGDFAISGRRVLASCGGQVCEFELPASLRTPPPRQHTFILPADDFSTSPGSAFAVANGTIGRVFRQSNAEPGSTRTAVFDATQWTNQSVQADVRPLEFNGNDHWVGLATRYQDAANHYYVTLRRSGSVQLKRMVNGVYSTLASAPLTVSVNRTYRARL